MLFPTVTKIKLSERISVDRQMVSKPAKSEQKYTSYICLGLVSEESEVDSWQKAKGQGLVNYSSTTQSLRGRQ